MHQPTFDRFTDLAKQGNLVPVYREILADLETPVSAFLKLDTGGDAFLLESVEGAEKWGRYSFLGFDPSLVLSSRGAEVTIGPPGSLPPPTRVKNPLKAARQFLARYQAVALPELPRFAGGLVGYLGYDLVRFFEKLPERAADELGIPDLYLMLVDTFLLFDSTRHRITIVSHAHVGDGVDLRQAYDAACTRIDALAERLNRAVDVPTEVDPGVSLPAPRVNLTQAEYEDRVRRAKEYIVSGDIIQVVLSQRREGELPADPFDIYRCLRTVNPAPYLFYLRVGGSTLIGSSPEAMVRLEGREVTVRPIAGTRPRGTDERQDAELEAELRADPKEIAEHIMLVDLGRNDVGRVAKTGTVRVTERMIVERYSHVMHLVSNVTGELADGLDGFDAFRATFPAGTLSGAPKIRAMEIIEELEPVRRGAYGGAVGYFAFSGNLDTCITIRTILVRNGRYYVQAGAGVVADSVPEREYAECVNKSRATLEAIRLATGMRRR